MRSADLVAHARMQRAVILILPVEKLMSILQAQCVGLVANVSGMVASSCTHTAERSTRTLRRVYAVLDGSVSEMTVSIAIQMGVTLLVWRPGCAILVASLGT